MKILIWELWRKYLVLFDLVSLYSLVDHLLRFGHDLEYDSLHMPMFFLHLWVNSQWWIGYTDPLISHDRVGTFDRLGLFSYDNLVLLKQLKYLNMYTYTTFIMRTYRRASVNSYTYLRVLLEVLHFKCITCWVFT